MGNGARKLYSAEEKRYLSCCVPVEEGGTITLSCQKTKLQGRKLTFTWLGLNRVKPCGAFRGGVSTAQDLSISLVGGADNDLMSPFNHY